MFYFSGPNIGRTKSPIRNHLNSESAYTDLFAWLAPDAGRLRQHEPFCFDIDSTVARAKHVLGRCKEKDFKVWQRGHDENSISLKQTDRAAWKRRVQLRSRWKLKTLSSEHRVKRFVKFLRGYESDHNVKARSRQRLVDHRLTGRAAALGKSGTLIPSPMMRDVLRRDFEHAHAAYHPFESKRAAHTGRRAKTQ